MGMSNKNMKPQRSQSYTEVFEQKQPFYSVKLQGMLCMPVLCGKNIKINLLDIAMFYISTAALIKRLI